MAIVRCFEEWRPELEGAQYRYCLIIRSYDHENVEPHTGTLVRVLVQVLNFKIVSRPGSAGRNLGGQNRTR